MRRDIEPSLKVRQRTEVDAFSASALKVLNLFKTFLSGEVDRFGGKCS